MNLTGVLPINKPPGMTSHDVVAIVRRTLRQGGHGNVKVGHAGTLDPEATGVLLVCVGASTRLADLLADQGKTYEAEFTLGAETTTEDAWGEIISETDASHITLDDVESVLRGLVGTILQTPPMVSAVHHEGKRLYELARQGITVDRGARPIEIKSIVLNNFVSGGLKPSGNITVECGKGTYIRTLCADLGKALEVGGHMSALCRTSVGTFRLTNCVSIDDHNLDLLQVTQHLVPASEAVSFLPMRSITESEKSNLMFGRAISVGEVCGDADTSGWIRLVDLKGELTALAIANETGESLQPKKVMLGEAQ